MPEPDYAELQCISNFSFLRGASHPEELVLRARALGYKALALTDECSLAGIVRAHLAAREACLPLIAGSSFRLGQGLQLILLATDRRSYGDLSMLISHARRRTSKGNYRLQPGELAEYGKNCLLIWTAAEQCTASVCLETAEWIQEYFTDRAWLGVTRRFDGRDPWRGSSSRKQPGGVPGCPVCRVSVSVFPPAAPAFSARGLQAPGSASTWRIMPASWTPWNWPGSISRRRRPGWLRQRARLSAGAFFSNSGTSRKRR